MKTFIKKYKKTLNCFLEVSKTNFDSIFANLVVLFFAAGLFISSLITDPGTYPKGYVLPKVEFIQLTFLMIILLISIYRILGLIKDGQTKNYFAIAIYIFIILFLTFSALASNYSQYVDARVNSNSIYDLIFKFIDANEVILIKTSIFGNEFRHEGLITYFLLITGFFLLSRFFNKFNFHIISISIILAGIIHSYFAVDQFYSLYVNDPDRLLEGMWIFGKFGQVNFFSGHLIVSLIFSAYYLRLKNIFLRATFGFLTALFLTVIFFSFSYWGFLVSIIMVVFIIAYEVLVKRDFFRFVYSFLFLGLVSIPVALSIVSKNFKDYTFRIEIWKNIFDIMIKAPISEFLDGNFSKLKVFLFGSGFDTLGELFVAHGKFNGQYIDRAHNLFFDILVNNGVIGLILFTALLICVRSKLQKNWKSREFMFSFFIFFALILRSQIHTQSIINIVHLMLGLFLMQSFAKARLVEKDKTSN